MATRARLFFRWVGWAYIGISILWLVLRSLFPDRAWVLLLASTTIDWGLVLWPILFIASVFSRQWKLSLGLSIPAIVLGLLLGGPSLPAFARDQAQNTIPASDPVSPTDTLFVCGWDEVFALQLGPNAATPTKIWSWQAATSPGLPKRMVPRFAATDECKPIDQGRRVLITSSTSGVALVEQATGQTLFYASVPGAHSAEVLPGNRLVATGSDNLLGGGTLEVFDLNRSDRPLWKTRLYSGHGVYWDGAHKTLWALSRYELRQYELDRWESQSPRLRLRKTFYLPSPGGHGFTPTVDRSALLITTDTDVVLFDLELNTFKSEPSLRGLALVKSVDVHPVTGRLAYVQADSGYWWSSRIHLLEPERSQAKQTIVLKGEQLYKARWIY